MVMSTREYDQIKNQFIPRHYVLGRNTSYLHTYEHPLLIKPKGQNRYAVTVDLGLRYSRDDRGRILGQKPKRRGGVISIVGRHGIGKSVTAKRIINYAYMCEPNRPGIIFDMVGHDHRLNVYENDSGLGFMFTDYGERPMSFAGKQVNLTPFHLKESCPYNDKFFSIPWRDMAESDWRWWFSNIADGGRWMETLISILMKARHNLPKLNILLEELRKARADKDYKSEFLIDEISPAEKHSMIIALRLSIESKVFSEDKVFGESFIIKYLQDGKILNISFHGDTSAGTKMVTGYCLRVLYKYYEKEMVKNKDDLIDAPWILIEEANKLVPAIRKNANDRSPGELWVHEIITKGMKIGFRLILVMQDIHDLNSEMKRAVLNDALICSNINYADLEIIGKIYGPEYKNVIRSLDLRRDQWGSVEHVYLSQSKEIYTFRPAICLSKLLLR